MEEEGGVDAKAEGVVGVELNRLALSPMGDEFGAEPVESPRSISGLKSGLEHSSIAFFHSNRSCGVIV